MSPYGTDRLTDRQTGTTRNAAHPDDRIKTRHCASADEVIGPGCLCLVHFFAILAENVSCRRHFRTFSTHHSPDKEFDVEPLKVQCLGDIWNHFGVLYGTF